MNHPGRRHDPWIQAQVEDLYRRLSDGEAAETAWMGTNRETVLWLLAEGESIPTNHPETVAGQPETRRMDEESSSRPLETPDRFLLLVVIALAMVDLTLTAWLAHQTFGWF